MAAENGRKGVDVPRADEDGGLGFPVEFDDAGRAPGSVEAGRTPGNLAGVLGEDEWAVTGRLGCEPADPFLLSSPDPDLAR